MGIQVRGSESAGRTEAARQLVGLAAHEDVDAVMLPAELVEELVLELAQCRVLLPGNGNGSCLGLGRPRLDEVFQPRVIDVIWEAASEVSTSMPRLAEDSSML